MFLLLSAFLLFLLSLFSFYMHYKTVSAKRLNIKTKAMVWDSVRKTGQPAIRRRIASL